MSFRKMRERAGLTLQAVGALVGVTHAAVSQWEQGVKMPRAERLTKLAAIYNCTVDELLAEDD